MQRTINHVISLQSLITIDYHGKNVPYRYISDILLNKVLIISDLILGK